MHETVIATSIVRTVCEEAAKYSVAGISAVRLGVGIFSCVEEATLKACFELVCENTLAEGAQLEVERLPASARCQECGYSFSLHTLRGQCPQCHGISLHCTGGRELVIQGIDCTEKGRTK